MSGLRERLAARARAVKAVRNFFESRGFLEVETSTLIPSPGLDVHLAAYEIATESGTRYLSTSPEYQMKELLAGLFRQGAGEALHAALFQITRAFRKDERGERHRPEFTMLEWYRAPAPVERVMEDTEQLVASLTGGTVTLGDQRHDTRPPFRRMTVLEAYRAFAGSSEEETLRMARDDEDAFYRLLIEKVEPGIEALGAAVFLTEYPATQASLARKKPGDPRVAERFELYVAGVELCNGFGELTDPVEQRARLMSDREERARRGLPLYPIDERFLASLAHLPPCAGNALGLDRLIALASGTRSIDAVMACDADGNAAS